MTSLNLQLTKFSTHIYPLLGDQITTENGLGEAVYQAEISSEKIPYLSDHKIKGKQLFPAAAYIDIFLCVLERYQIPSQLSDIRFTRPLIIDRPIKIQTRIVFNDRQLNINVWAKKEGAKFWKMYANARAVQSKSHQSKIYLPHIANDNKDHCNYYAWANNQGFEYGNWFKAVQNIVIEGHSATGIVKLPDGMNDMESNFFHPVLMDSCFQIMLFLVKPHMTNNSVALPVSIRSLCCTNKAHRELTVFARLVSASEETFEFDLSIADKNKNLIAELNGIKTHSIQSTKKD